MEMNSVFDELGLVGKLATSSSLTQRNTNNKQSREQQSMQRIELPKTM
jgi:hypothetical protein